MATILKYICIVVELLVIASPADLRFCGPGHYSYQPALGPEVCIECPNGQFMPYESHQETSCFPCTQITDPDKQFEISPCTGTHDARIGRTCTEGQHSYDPASGPDVCVKCPDGRFMPYKDHNEPTCFLCAEITDKDKQSEISPCNRTHDARIGCTKGNYWSRPNPREPGSCRECSRCEFTTEMRPCSATSDTICCNNTHYKLVPNGDGAEVCQPIEVICEAGEFVYSEGHTCNSCPPGTFMNLSDHRETSCRTCQRCTDRTDGKTLEVAKCNLTQDTVCELPDTEGMQTIRHNAEPTCIPSTSSKSQDNWEDGLVKFVKIALGAVLTAAVAIAISAVILCRRAGGKF